MRFYSIGYKLTILLLLSARKAGKYHLTFQNKEKICLLVRHNFLLGDWYQWERGGEEGCGRVNMVQKLGTNECKCKK
jgi:hypothetical protein